jgi:hypothetical protein
VVANLAEGEHFFFEKKKQKTFGRFGFGLSGTAQHGIAKVFWFFFSKKNCFFCRLPSRRVLLIADKLGRALMRFNAASLSAIFSMVLTTRRWAECCDSAAK